MSKNKKNQSSRKLPSALPEQENGPSVSPPEESGDFALESYPAHAPAPRPAAPSFFPEVEAGIEVDVDDMVLEVNTHYAPKPKLPDRVETDRQRQEAVDRATPSRPLPKDPIPGRLSASDFESKSARLVRQPSPAAQDRPADDGLFESVPGIGEEKIVTEHRVATTQPQPERTAPDDVEDYLRDIDKPREISPKVRIPLTIVEKSCLGGAAVLVLSAVIWFSSTLFGSRPRGGEEPPSIRPSLPMKGSLFTIEAATTGWRDATAGDKLSMMAITFPVRGERQPAIVPTVQVTMASLPQSGYMRIIFRDPAGKQAGDTRILKVNGGALEPTHSGEEILSGTQAIVHCSKGYLSEQDLITYQAAADQDRWAVEIAESADYGAADKDWKRLGFFQINNKY